VGIGIAQVLRQRRVFAERVEIVQVEQFGRICAVLLNGRDAFGVR